MDSPLQSASLSMKQVGFTLSTRHGALNMRGRTAVMGILNVTPDSFSDGGQYMDSEVAIARGIELAAQGADIIDIGGESTRPGALDVTAEEEMERVLPIVRGLRHAVSLPLSIDTTKADVARRALDEGADVINDVSALRFDPEMVSLAAREKVPVVLMHMQGHPRTMQVQPQYQDLLKEVCDFLRERVTAVVAAGVAPDAIMIDPGIGFGKNLDHNLTLMRCLAEFKALGRPILVGASRKTFIGMVLQLSAQDRLEGSLAAAVAAAFGGAHMVRVHDVKETVRALRVVDGIRFGLPKTREEQTR